MAPTAKLVYAGGSLDFSTYLRVNPDDGLDPYSEGFEEPLFEDTAAEGEALRAIGVHNREQRFPLFVSFGGTKDALHAVVRAVRAACLKPDLQLYWQDQGATDPTYYSVAAARFEPAFHYRRAAKGYLAGVLHVWISPPYGTTGTDRLVASGASYLLASFGVASLLGDVPALLTVPVAHSSSVVRADRWQWTWAALMPSGVAVLNPGPSMAGAGGSIYGDVNSLASQALRMTRTSTAVAFQTAATVLSGDTAGGRYRLLAAVRPASSISFLSARPADLPGYSCPTVTLGSVQHEWQLVDLGVITAAPSYNAGAARVDFTLGGPSLPASGQAIADIGYVLTLPEGRSMIVRDAVYPPASGPSSIATGVASMLIDGVGNRVLRRREVMPASNMQLDPSHTPVDGRRYGGIPALATEGWNVQVGQVRCAGPTQAVFRPFAAALKVRERFGFAR